MKGFVSKTSLAVVRPAESLLPRCGSCGLFERGCESPKMKPHGKGRRRVLVVGEAPGRNEDKKGIQFVGKAGEHLWSTVDRLGFSRDDCWTTNAIICWPHEGERNRTPTPKEIEYCRPTLERTIREKDPDVILLLGAVPISSFLTPRFPSPMSFGGMGRWTGWKIPCRSPNAWVCPTWHPSYILREKDKPNGGVLQREWERHLAQAFGTEGKPWESIPNETRKVQSILDPEEAAEAIWETAIRASETGGPISWDLETNCLKPDGKDAKIVSCSISNEERTVSFPWHGEAVKAAVEFVKSDIPKIGANTKFESRWLKAKHGVWPRNWVWDTMLAAHILDNRPGISGHDFQAFVRLGMPNYWSHLSPFMRSKGKGGNKENRVGKWEVGIGELLTYNGLDALTEFKVAEKQAEEMGVKIC